MLNVMKFKDESTHEIACDAACSVQPVADIRPAECMSGSIRGGGAHKRNTDYEPALDCWTHTITHTHTHTHTSTSIFTNREAGVARQQGGCQARSCAYLIDTVQLRCKTNIELHLRLRTQCFTGAHKQRNHKGRAIAPTAHGDAGPTHIQSVSNVTRLR